MSNKISSGVAHQVPADLRKALAAKPGVVEIWNSLTPLARNEWICWTIDPKLPKTREDHVRRVVSELKAGKRRPCCWIGCIHRKDKAISPSIKGILEKRNKKAKK